MPWRSQANLIQATCYLDTLLGRLGHSEVSTDTEPHLHQPHGLTFDAVGVIIDGVLPIHPPVLAGAEAKVTTMYSIIYDNYLFSCSHSLRELKCPVPLRLWLSMMYR